MKVNLERLYFLISVFIFSKILCVCTYIQIYSIPYLILIKMVLR